MNRARSGKHRFFRVRRGEMNPRGRDGSLAFYREKPTAGFRLNALRKIRTPASWMATTKS
ncbi:MAG: hypothetical protein ACFFCS_12735 [Candidatus Hodarchaeota archaeon]